MITNPRGIPVRLHIKQELTALLRSIRRADGYTFDLGQANGKEQVRCGVDLFSNKDSETLVAISESSEQGAQQLGIEHYPIVEKRTYVVIIMGRTIDDRENPTLPADYLLADLKEKITRHAPERGDNSVIWNIPRTEFGPRIEQSGFGDHFTRPPDSSPEGRTKFAFCWLPVWFELWEDPREPYVLTPPPTP